MQISVPREATAVTLMLFVKILLPRTSARVKQALKGTANSAKTLMNAISSTMVAVYTNVTTYQAIIAALATMDSC